MTVVMQQSVPEQRPGLDLFGRYLTLWVALCIVAGIGLGELFPSAFVALAAMEVEHVNLPVAVLIWLMIIPMLMKIDFARMREVGQQARAIGVTLAVNWLIKPFTMAALGALFIYGLFADWLPADQLDSYVAGLILLGAAPCTAMVFVWSNLVDGEPNFTLSQVALNDAVMVFAFAPIVALLLGVSAISVPWATLLLSVGLYILVPLLIAQGLRAWLLARGAQTFERVQATLGPVSMLALLVTLVLLFGFQGRQILAQPLIILLLAVPIVIQAYLIAAIAMGLNHWLKVPHRVAGPSALIGTSNFFELAVAVAISLFGLGSGAALATVVGVLVEVPVMLSLVAWIRRRAPVQAH
jgi:ACR3 family arsenite transporter